MTQCTQNPKPHALYAKSMYSQGSIIISLYSARFGLVSYRLSHVDSHCVTTPSVKCVLSAVSVFH